jgi:branched-chain amino acid transport system permease protein
MAAFLLVLPVVLSDFNRVLVSEMLIIGIFAMSLNLIMGYGGMVHFGHAAFYGIGAYSVAILTTRYDWLPLPAMIVAPFIAAGFAVVIGWFCVRRVRLYFAILTLAFGQLIYIVVNKSRDFAGGDDGIHGLQRPAFLRSINLFGLKIDDNILLFYFFTAFIFLVCYWLMRVFVRSPFILLLRAIRENPERAQFIGVDVRRHQLIVFVVGSFFAGVAGALIAQEKRFASLDWLHWTSSAEPILASLLGGMFSLPGPAIGAAVLVYLNNSLSRYTTYWHLVLGTLTVIMVLIAPTGIVGLIRRIFGVARAED